MNFNPPSWVWFSLCVLIFFAILWFLGYHVRIVHTGEFNVVPFGKGWARNCVLCP